MIPLKNSNLVIKSKKFIVIAMSLLLVSFSFSACSKSDNDIALPNENTQSSSSDIINTEKTNATNTNTTTIKLNGESAEITGTGASATGSVVKITNGGSYTVSGFLTDGRLIVDAKGQEVTLNLSGADITCSYSSPIYVYNSKQTTITLADGTENKLSDGESYSFDDSLSSEIDEEPNACLYSKSDLIINGSGSLLLSANYNNGITSKDTLIINDSTLDITAKNHGINGKDSNKATNANITVTSGGDAIRSTNADDSSVGIISLKDTNLNLSAGEDGIQAENSLTIDGGNYKIKSGGGSSTTPSTELSTKAIKSTGEMTINSGTFNIDSSDDAFHSNSNLTINGGIFTISTGDDGFHADETFTINDGDINIEKSYEGLEGARVEINGGNINLFASDDGINAAGGADGTNEQPGGPMDSFGGNSDYYIKITGGSLVVNADGDGIDSNGDVTMTDGTVIVNGPTNDGDASLDYDGNFYLEGGLLVAAGSSGMAQTPDNPIQNVISVSFDERVEAGNYIQIKNEDDSVDFVFKTSKSVSNIIYSSADIKTGDSYTVSYGGSYSGGTETDGVCSGGTYSSGTILTTLTVSEVLTTYGQVGMGGSMGGHRIGGMGPGGNPGEGTPRM